MKSEVIRFLKYAMLIIIPALSVAVCVLFRVAQGEKTEEILFGVLVGFAVDIVYLVILILTDIITTRRKHR